MKTGKKGVTVLAMLYVRWEWGNVKAEKVLYIRTTLFKPEVDR